MTLFGKLKGLFGVGHHCPHLFPDEREELQATLADLEDE
jgi:hypothetical protein